MALFLKQKTCKCGKKALPNRRICYQCWLLSQRKKREDKLAKQAVSKERKKVIKIARKELTTGYLDTLWSKKVKILAGEKCEYCGSQDNLQSHHIFGRCNFSVRWDYRNGVCLCAGHHTFKNDFAAHRTPTIFTDWIICKRGENWHKDLVVRARVTLQVDRKFFLGELINISK